MAGAWCRALSGYGAWLCSRLTTSHFTARWWHYSRSRVDGCLVCVRGILAAAAWREFQWRNGKSTCSSIGLDSLGEGDTLVGVHIDIGTSKKPPQKRQFASNATTRACSWRWARARGAIPLLFLHAAAVSVDSATMVGIFYHCQPHLWNLSSLWLLVLLILFYYERKFVTFEGRSWLMRISIFWRNKNNDFCFFFTFWRNDSDSFDSSQCMYVLALPVVKHQMNAVTELK